MTQLPFRMIKSGHYIEDNGQVYEREYAQFLDERDPLRHFREEFIIPSKKDLKRKKLAVEGVWSIQSFIHV
jgi:kynureninase